MFCVLCRRLLWRDPKPAGHSLQRRKQNARSPQGGGEDPKQCPGDGGAWDGEIRCTAHIRKSPAGSAFDEALKLRWIC